MDFDEEPEEGEFEEDKEQYDEEYKEIIFNSDNTHLIIHFLINNKDEYVGICENNKELSAPFCVCNKLLSVTDSEEVKKIDDFFKKIIEDKLDIWLNVLCGGKIKELKVKINDYIKEINEDNISTLIKQTALLHLSKILVNNSVDNYKSVDFSALPNLLAYNIRKELILSVRKTNKGLLKSKPVETFLSLNNKTVTEFIENLIVDCDLPSLKKEEPKNEQPTTEATKS